MCLDPLECTSFHLKEVRYISEVFFLDCSNSDLKGTEVKFVIMFLNVENKVLE